MEAQAVAEIFAQPLWALLGGWEGSQEIVTPVGSWILIKLQEPSKSPEQFPATFSEEHRPERVLPALT